MTTKGFRQIVAHIYLISSDIIKLDHVQAIQ
jgi:hypothetical protein